MTALQKDGKLFINPNTMSFNIVLKAWKNSGGGIESAKRAEDILRLMIKLYSDGHHDVRPDMISFQTVIHAYAKHADDGRLSADFLDQLEGVLDALLDGESDLARRKGIVSKTANKVIEYIGKSDVDDASDRANRILEQMTAARDSGISLDSPDSITYTHLMNSYLSNTKTVHKALALMENLINGNTPVLPTTFCINTLLHHHCKKNDIASAESLFEAMTNVAQKSEFNTLPDVATYNMMTDLYFRSRRRDSFEKAFSILKQTEIAFDVGTVSELDPFIYEVVIKKLSKSKEPETRRKSYDVLMRMVNRYDNGALQTQPDVTFYNIVLSTLAKERTQESTVKALVRELK
jgi:pentatricopeptide repeat protein